MRLTVQGATTGNDKFHVKMARLIKLKIIKIISKLTFLLHGSDRRGLLFDQGVLKVSNESPRIHTSLLPDGQYPLRWFYHLRVAFTTTERGDDKNYNDGCWIYVIQMRGMRDKKHWKVESSRKKHCTNISTKHLLNQLEGVWKHLGECCSVNDGIFPFTVLDDVIGEV